MLAARIVQPGAMQSNPEPPSGSMGPFSGRMLTQRKEQENYLLIQTIALKPARFCYFWKVLVGNKLQAELPYKLGIQLSVLSVKRRAKCINIQSSWETEYLDGRAISFLVFLSSFKTHINATLSREALHFPNQKLLSHPFDSHVLISAPTRLSSPHVPSAAPSYPVKATTGKL